MWYMRLAETGRVPDWLVIAAVRAMLAYRRWRRERTPLADLDAERRAFLASLRASPVAVDTEAPNRQHYELPVEFFELILGKRLKYSCSYWRPETRTIHEAEEAMLRLTCQRARIEDGQEILDLGCGWGSFALWVAERYPNSRVWAVTNSRRQKAFIDAQCRRLWLDNVSTATMDVGELNLPRRFDRVVSIEMFEHMRNYDALMARIAQWLRPGGLLFVHLFSHAQVAHAFDAADKGDWMARNFFTGGTMPSDDLLLRFQRDLYLVDAWRVDGTHYAQTLNAWRRRLDANSQDVRRVLAHTYGPENERRWLVNWRLFFLACAGIWGFCGGREYLVSHYLFAPR